ncbi:SulP family inorganic anion transporter [Alsobacter sp. SYSU M60028]|uniref:SulP family inorganic anion transporter n=1 Tax=Alsobacter ponti TaxID=2962936 RepID=A0ABT1L9V3_9HYPH|nr:SulP family inorganic anion transporter [Alsobacter ponti]
MVDQVETELPGRPWYQEFAAGISVATVSIPAALAAGVLSFSALGSSYLFAGAVFGLLAGAISALLSAAVFRASAVAGPVSTVCVTQAILISSLASHPALANDPLRMIALMTAGVLFTGLAQLGLAMLKAGSIIEFTPYPVVAGFLNGVAFLTISSQVLFVLNRSSLGDLVTRPPAELAAWAPLVFLVVFVKIGLLLPRLAPRLPAAAVNFAAGIALYYAALTVVPEHWLGPRLSVAEGPLDAVLTGPSELLVALTGLPSAVFVDLVLGALTVAAIGIVETSMTARMVENASHHRVDKYRLLMWLGLTNMLASPMGVPSSGSMSQTAAMWRSGGLGPASDLVRAGAMILVATVGIGLLNYVPFVVVSGQLVLIGIGIFDSWSVRQVIRMARSPDDASRHIAKRSIAVIAIVMVVTASGYVVLGAALGMMAACWIFIADSASLLIRSRHWGDVARSKKTRSMRDVSYLREHAKETLVLALQGPVFFGNVAELSRDTLRVDSRTKNLVLDLRRVTSIDASAIATFGAIVRRWRSTARSVSVCGVPVGLAFALEELKSYDPTNDQLFFVDRDAALEACEERILGRLDDRTHPSLGATLGELEVTRGFSAEQNEKFGRRLSALSLAGGDLLCREGDDGDAIWIIVEGSVGIWINVGSQGKAIRVGSYGAGTAVGEMAFLRGARRTASIVAEGPLSCFALSQADFDALGREDPLLATLFFKNIARILAERLSVTTDQIRAAEDA